MTNPGQNLRSLSRRILLHGLVLAEAVALAVAWRISRQGKATLASLFRRRIPEETLTTNDV